MNTLLNLPVIANGYIAVKYKVLPWFFGYLGIGVKKIC